MKNLSKFLFFLIIILALLVYHLTLDIVMAEDAIPPPRIPCVEEAIENPEFHSLRPYQASPCGDSVKAIYCNNVYQITEEIKTEWDSNRCDESTITCVPKDSEKIIGGPDGKNYYIKLVDAQYPIIGNTQDVFNSQAANEGLDDTQKMNEYLAWYLAGVNQKAEYGPDTPERTVNFSGPLKKITPSVIQELQRFIILHDAGTKIEYTDDDDDGLGIDTNSSEDGVQITETFQHSQIAVCTAKNFFGIDNPWIGEEKPVPCYKGDGGNAKDNKMRLVAWWEGKHQGLIESFKVIEDWNPWLMTWRYSTPPFPWQFTKDVYYRKAYNEWRGEECILIPITEILACADIKIPNVLELHTNKWADFYQYIPLGNTVDKKAKHVITGLQVRGANNTQATIIAYEEVLPGDNPILYYAHTRSTYDMLKLLNDVQTPQDVENKEVGSKVEPTTCTFTEVRSNSGDDLIFDNSKPETRVKIDGVMTEVSLIDCQNKDKIINWIEACENSSNPPPPNINCDSPPSCSGEVYINIPTYPKIPYIDALWKSSVAGEDSAFRRIFPKIEEGAPVSCIKEIPGTTKIKYEPVDTNLTKVMTAGPNTYAGPAGSVIEGQLFFPHLGTISEYFLKGIQTALRPKGYGDPLISGELCPTEEEEENMCPEVPDSEVPEKFLGDYKANYLSKADVWTTTCSGAENNLAEECYNYVVTESLDKNVNPAFSLTMWLEESDASNYCFLESVYGSGKGQDFGINRSDVPSQNIVKQLEAFLELAQEKLCSGVQGFVQPIHGWLTHFRSTDYSKRCDPTDPCGYAYTYGGSCTVDGATKEYGGIINIWQIVNNTVSGNCINSGKFSIDWPTSMSCP